MKSAKSHLCLLISTFWALICVHAVRENAFGQYADRCPWPCSRSGSDSANWTRVYRLSDLGHCNDPVLFDINVQNSVDDIDSQITMSVCSQADSISKSVSDPLSPPNSVHTVCGAKLSQTSLKAQITAKTESSPAFELDGEDVSKAVGQLVSYIRRAAPCGTNIMFAKSGNVIVGMYSGAEIQRESAAKVIEKLQQHTSLAIRTLQVCLPDSIAARTLGVFVGSLDKISMVQGAVKSWTNGQCITLENPRNESLDVDLGFLVSEIDASNISTTAVRSRRALCRDTQVAAGDSCASLASRCRISGNDFTKFNPKKDLCSTLKPKQWVCCTAGDLPDHRPQPNPDGTCNWYKVQSEDGCWSIGESFGIDQKRIEEVNKKTWGWAGCSRLQQGQRICLSPGTPPFPPAVPDTQCGPQVLGTKKPIDGTPWEQLNPCPLKACCDVWGFCGTTAEFCTKTPADTGAPGTAKPGTNGCISNCGTNIVNNDKPPAFFRTVGYFESWNHRRPCLKMDARQIDTRAVNHVHFAFATLDKDFGVSIDDNVKEQWRQFRELKTKRVASFGGWDFSTKPDTLWRFRDATKAENRLTFAGNAVAFLIKEGIDGLDFDWEYPSAPDIDGVPPGSEAEGKNYLEFLKLVRTKLPPGKTLSIALPASFWYLKPYPLEELAKVCDYFVYMTYDFHGQWDMNNKWATSGCPKGNCLRSHINKTLTETALSMITKAGVPASKVLVGVSSYGRSFRMSQPDCFGPMCTYTGTRSRSDAYHGRCTNTGGYISNAEIEEIIESNPKQYPLVRQLFDKSSDSNILIYGTRQQADYVAFMKAPVKQGRSDWVRQLNFGGTTDWAVDLMEFKQRKEDEDLPGPDGTCFRAEKTFERATQPIGQFWRPLQNTGRQYVTIVNMTPHIFELKSSPSRNFENFSWRSVPPGRAAQNTVVYRSSAGDGEASYEIRGTGKRFYVRVGSASKLVPVPGPGDRVVMFDLSDMGNGQREYNFPGEEACVTLVITGSASFGFVTSLSPWTGPRGWMSAIKDVIKDRSLADVVMPGTHDSGMSIISNGIASFGSEMNTQTQALNIYDQLSFGSRWFDLRVSSVHKIGNFDDFTFWSMHLNDETADFPVGNTGERFSTIIDEINKFTSENPGEIIILQLRYLTGITMYLPPSVSFWNENMKNEFFKELKKINNRCPNLNTDDSNTIDKHKMGELMGRNGGKGCVLIFLNTSNLKRKIPDEEKHISVADGFYHWENSMKWKDAWPNEESTIPMVDWAVKDWQSRKSRGYLHVAQWLCTPNAAFSTFVQSLEDIALIPTNPSLYWAGVNEMSPEVFPSVLMVDYFGRVRPDSTVRSNDLLILTLGLNLYMVSENCEINKRRSPLLPGPDRGTRSVNPLISSWNGIIFANGTTIDHPPPGLHPGRLEILQNGTVFDNGTVLKEDIPNPDFNSAW